MTRNEWLNDSEEFLRRLKQVEAQNETSGGLGGICMLLSLLIIGAGLFGIAYVISLGWHMGGS